MLRYAESRRSCPGSTENGDTNAAAVSAAAVHLCGLHRTAAAAHPAGGRGRLPPPRYTEQYQANANNANYNNPQQTYYAPNGQPQYGQNYAQPYDPPQGTKSRIAAGVLAILFGVFGVHNFYIGKTGLGIAQLAITVCSCGTLAIVSEIWGIIEGVRLLQGTIYTDGHGMKFVD